MSILGPVNAFRFATDDLIKDLNLTLQSLRRSNLRLAESDSEVEELSQLNFDASVQNIFRGFYLLLLAEFQGVIDGFFSDRGFISLKDKVMELTQNQSIDSLTAHNVSKICLVRDVFACFPRHKPFFEAIERSGGSKAELSDWVIARAHETSLGLSENDGLIITEAFFMFVRKSLMEFLTQCFKNSQHEALPTTS